jgi:hypothetical protein
VAAAVRQHLTKGDSEREGGGECRDRGLSECSVGDDGGEEGRGAVGWLRRFGARGRRIIGDGSIVFNGARVGTGGAGVDARVHGARGVGIGS